MFEQPPDVRYTTPLLPIHDTEVGTHWILATPHGYAEVVVDEGGRSVLTRFGLEIELTARFGQIPEEMTDETLEKIQTGVRQLYRSRVFGEEWMGVDKFTTLRHGLVAAVFTGVDVDFISAPAWSQDKETWIPADIEIVDESMTAPLSLRTAFDGTCLDVDLLFPEDTDLFYEVVEVDTRGDPRERNPETYGFDSSRWTDESQAARD